MTGKVLYKSSVSRDLRKINQKDVGRILREIRTSLGAGSDAGEPLVGEFKGLFKLRVGDHRMICAVADDDVLVLRIGHRNKIYG